MNRGPEPNRIYPLSETKPPEPVAFSRCDHAASRFEPCKVIQFKRRAPKPELVDFRAEVRQCVDLWSKVFIQAISDLGAKSDNERASAVHWFKSAHMGIGSFLWVCDLFRLDPEIIRTRISNELTFRRSKPTYWGQPCRLILEHVVNGRSERYRSGGCYLCHKERNSKRERQPCKWHGCEEIVSYGYCNKHSGMVTNRRCRNWPARFLYAPLKYKVKKMLEMEANGELAGLEWYEAGLRLEGEK